MERVWKVFAPRVTEALRVAVRQSDYKGGSVVGVYLCTAAPEALLPENCGRAPTAARLLPATRTPKQP
jgi:hypothetical protein